MKRIIILMLSLTVLFSCKKEEPSFPKFGDTLSSINLNELIPIDENRICLAEPISKLFGNIDFRVYIKQHFVNEDENWNNEFIIVHHLEDQVNNDFTLRELINDIIIHNNSFCISTIQEFEQRLSNDMLLVLKIPDIIDAHNWNTTSTVPFTYVSTKNRIKIPSEEYYVKVGIHPSGAINGYFFKTPTYFPVVLKNSEDYVLVNSELELHSGVNLHSLHSFISDDVDFTNLINNYPNINDTGWHLVKFNELLHKLNEKSNALETSFEVIDCQEQCEYSCMTLEERKLITNKFTVKVYSTDLNHFYDASFRLKSELILYDNAVPLLIQSQHNNISDPYFWNNILLGSFRLNDVFDVDRSMSVRFETFEVNCELVDLPLVDIEFDVTSINSIDIDKIRLTSDIMYGDKVKVGFYNTRFNIGVSNFYVDANDTEVFVSDLRNQYSSNYFLYCIESNDTLGMNSFAIEVGF